MPRPISWLPRLHEITRTVKNSVRSHYDRRDLERLFQLQPRAAQKLLEVMPATRIGTSRLVEHDVLAGFLERVRVAPDTGGLFDLLREERREETASRSSPRSLVRRDLEPVTLDGLPDAITLTPGSLHVRFATTEQLAESMLLLARILESDGDNFARTYEPAASARPDPSREEFRKLFAGLKARGKAEG